jgi:hypothetical protein
MSPATSEYPPKDIKLSEFDEQRKEKNERQTKEQSQFKKLFLEIRGQTYYLPNIIGQSGKTIAEILFEIDEKAKINGADPTYSKLYRRLQLLAKYQLFNLIKKEKVDWEATNKARMDEIEKSVQKIFADEVAKGKDTPPMVSGGTSPTEGKQVISTVKIIEKEVHVVPTGQLLYLFSQVQNSSTGTKCAKKQTSNWWDKLYSIPKRCSAERVEAIKTLMSAQGRSLFQRDCTCPMCGKIGRQNPGQKNASCSDPKCGVSWVPPIQPRLQRKLNYCQTTFGIWEKNTLDKELFFDRGPGSAMVRLPVRTRFTDKGRKVKNLRTYERAWNRATFMFSRGVFLTLTTDPSLHKSLWHANRHLTRAWNRYLTLLVTKKKKAKQAGHSTEKEENDQFDNGTGRLRYIAAYEFQENGLIHMHICFFGIRYLASMDQIAKDWNGCGQGRIAHAYGIRKNGNAWEWNREKPADACGKSPVEYLKKYLEKALYVSEAFPQYWAINKRFCTMSRLFQTKECEGCRKVWPSPFAVCPECGAPLKQISKGYRYLGALFSPQRDAIPSVEMMKEHRSPWPDGDRCGGFPGSGVPA